MTLEQMGTTAQETKDNIGNRDTTKDMILLRNKEVIYVEENPQVIEKQLIGTAWIWGHPNNAKFGTSKWGNGTLGSYTRYAVVNPYNIFHEHLRDTEFKDATNTTANWDTVNFRIEFSPNDEMRTNAIFYNYQELAKIKPTITVSGIKVTSQIDTTNHPGGRTVNLT